MKIKKKWKKKSVWVIFFEQFLKKIFNTNSTCHVCAMSCYMGVDVRMCMVWCHFVYACAHVHGVVQCCVWMCTKYDVMSCVYGVILSCHLCMYSVMPCMHAHSCAAVCVYVYAHVFLCDVLFCHIKSVHMRGCVQCWIYVFVWMCEMLYYVYTCIHAVHIACACFFFVLLEIWLVNMPFVFMSVCSCVMWCLFKHAVLCYSYVVNVIYFILLTYPSVFMLYYIFNICIYYAVCASLIN